MLTSMTESLIEIYKVLRARLFCLFEMCLGILQKIVN